MDTRTGKTVLLVEDEAIIAMNEAVMLQRHGYSVLQAYNGDEAIRKVDDNSVDLILMDIDLGINRMSGTQAASEILEKHTLPIVFLTSHTEKQVVDLVKNITRYGYVVKNSGEFVLLESIAMAFELFETHQRLKESEDRYRTAFITSPDAINLNRMDGLYVDVNEGFTALTGYTREDVIGINSSEIKIWAVPEDRERLIQGLQAHGYVENLESTFRLKNGYLLQGLMSARVLTINGQPHILSITRDISRRNAATDKIKESELLYRTIIQNNCDAFMRVDATGHILDVNDASCRLCGYGREELLSMSVEDIEASQTPEEIRAAMDAVLKTGVASFHTVHKKKSGMLLPVAVSITHIPLHGNGQEKSHEKGEFAVFVREVTNGHTV